MVFGHFSSLGPVVLAHLGRYGLTVRSICPMVLSHLGYLFGCVGITFFHTGIYVDSTLSRPDWDRSTLSRVDPTW